MSLNDCMQTLDSCEKRLQELRDLHHDSVAKNEIDSDYVFRLKNILADLRDCLDYLATYLHSKYEVCSNRKVYFPYAHEREDISAFRSKVAKIFPNCSNMPSIMDILEKCQHFSEGYWLVRLANLVNTGKHTKLPQQQIANNWILSIELTIPPSGQVSLDLSQLADSKFPVTATLGTQMEVQASTAKMIEYKDTETPSLMFANVVFENVRKLVNQIKSTA